VKQYQNFDKNINRNTNGNISSVYTERIAVRKKEIQNPEKYDGV
jgi:hypothetical protein